MPTLSTHRTTFPRRALTGRFATPVRSDDWRLSDLDGQAAAQQLAELGATAVEVNTFGVAYGHLDGTRVLISKHNPARACSCGCGGVLITRARWTQQTGNFVHVPASAVAA